MTGYMNIRITVLANQARKAIADTEASVSRLNAKVAAAGVGTEQFARKQDVAFKAMNKWGNQLQWTGRQLEYNWTLPLAVAGAAATKFALDVDRSMTQVKKVYGDTNLSIAAQTNELAALEKAFVALSNRYGIHQKEVADIAAGWAAAGASGLGLAKNVELTMKTMVLGELEAAEATQALIAIQAQYGFTADQLSDTMARLNAIENETGTNTHDLVVAFQRAAGMARVTGVDVQHLGAMIAAITPAAGTATQAGNALKTIFQRLFSPTKEANRVLGEIGISTEEMSWQTANASVRLETLAGKWTKLSDSQRSVAASTLFGIEQANRAVVLLDEMTRETGFYARALRVAGDNANYFEVASEELNAVLDSSAHKWDQAVVILQNAMIKVIQPLLPMIIGLAQQLAEVATSFANLNPNMQKLIVFGLLALAVLGPLVRYFGSLFTLIGVLGRAFSSTAMGLGALAGMLGLTSRAAKAAAASTAAAAATSSAAAATATAAAAASGGGFLSRMAAGVRKGAGALDGAMTTVMGRQVGIATAGGQKVTAAYRGKLASLKDVASKHLTGATGAMKSGATRMVTAFAGTMRGLLLPSFSGTLARMSLLWNLHNIKMSAQMRGHMARMVAWWGVSWRTGMLGTMRTALVGMVTSMAAGMTAMLGPIARWAVFAGKNWTFIWTGMLDKMYGVLTRMTAAYYTATTRMGGITTVFGYLWSGLWSGIGAATTRIWAVMNLGLTKISQASYARLVALTAAFRMNMSILWSLMAFHMRGIWISLGNGLTKIWAVALTRMRLMWTAFVAFLASPAALMKAFARIGAVFAAGSRGILAIMTLLGKGLLAAITSPWTLAIAAVIGLIVLFRDQLRTAYYIVVAYFRDANNEIIAAFNALPVGIKNAVVKVVAVVRAAALKVYEWFSYLNPFARHSPSLVENVTNGMAMVRQQFGTLTQVEGPISKAYASIKRLKDITADLRNGEASFKIAEDIEKLGKAAPQAIPAYRELVAVMADLTVRQDQLADVIATQEQRNNAMKVAVDASTASLDRQKDILTNLEEVAQGYEDTITNLRSRISELASTPLSGMGAMEDAIWGNEMAQKRLRLEMMRMEDAGATYDDIKNKVASLNGELDSMRGEQDRLRGMGAGSDILSTYDAQIKKLEDQKAAIEESSAPIAEMSSELEKLQRDAERMDLEKALAFDPLTRQIEKAADTMAEMPFDQVIGQIRQNQSAIDQLTPAYDAANRAVDAQRAVIDAAQASHDALSASYDLEQQKLEALRDAYSAVADAIGDVNTSLSDMRGSADSAIKVAEDATKDEYVSPAVQNFRNAEGGNFADVGGGLEDAMKLGREGGYGDQSADIDAFTKGIEDELADSFGGLDMLGPFKDMWAAVVRWWDANVGPWITAIGGLFGKIFDGVDFTRPITEKFNGLWDKVFDVSFADFDWSGLGTRIADGFRTALTFLGTIGSWIWDLFGEELLGTFSHIWNFAKDAFGAVGDVLGQLGERVLPLLEAFRNFAAVVGIILTPVIVYLMAILQTLWSVFNGVLGPVLDWIVGLFKNVWQAVIGLIDMFIGLFTLDFGRFFSGFGNVLGGLGGIIWDTIVSLGIIIVNAAGALVNGVWDSFMWIGQMIWDGLAAGLKAIGLGWLTDIFGGIIDWVKDFFGIASPSKVFADIGGWLMEGLGQGIKTAWNVVSAIFTAIFNSVKVIFESIGVIVTWLWKTIFEPAFNAIGAIFSWLWDTIISPFITRFMAGLQVWGDRISSLWTGVIQPIFGFIGEIFSWIWTSVIQPIIGFIIDYIQTWAAIIGWLWDNVVKPILGFIGDLFSWLWDKVIKPIIGFIIDYIQTWAAILGWLWDHVAKPIFNFIGGAFEVLGSIIAWVWNNVIKPAWNAIETAAKWMWENVLKPAFDAIKSGFQTMGDGLSWVWNNIIKPAWDALKSAATSVADWVSEKFTWMKDTVGKIFQGIKDLVSEIWNGLIDTVKAPIRIVFDFVNGSMIDPINGLLSKFPGDLEIPHLPALKEGGLLRGPGTGRSDSILGLDKAGVPTARVSNGEYVVNAKATRENYSLIDAINRGKKLPGYDLGGIVGGIGRGLGAAWDKASDGAQWVGNALGDLVAKGGRWAGEQILRPLANTVKGMVPGDGIFPTTMRGFIDKMVDGVLGKGDEHDKQQATLAGGNFGRYPATPNGMGGLSAVAQAARNFVISTFGISNIGGYANRNIAGTSARSDHATGKAIDVMIANYKSPAGISLGNRVASHFVANPEQFGTKYVIWKSQINEGNGWKGYGHPGGGRSDTLQHEDHVHASFYDTGGVMRSGALAMNMSGRPERVLDPRQTVAFERLVSILDTTGVPSVSAMEAAIFRAEARAQQAETIGNQTIIQNEGDTNITNNFYGDLSFPNIKDGDDADVFIQNLSDLAGGRK